MSEDADNSDVTMSGDELSVLKARAKMMGITFSNNIGIEALRAKINAKMDGEPDPTPEPEAVNPLGSTEVPKPSKPINQQAAIRKALVDKYMALVRIRIQNLDPKKKDLPGEIYTVANEYIGTVSKYVPYGEVTDDGYHVPYCIYTLLSKRKFVNITKSKDRKTGMETQKFVMAKEFSIEVLPSLTSKELQDLATAQRAAGSLD